MKCMLINKKFLATNVAFFLALSFFLATTSMITPIVSAASPTITFTPSQATPGSKVTVTGTGFAANSAVGIGFGTQMALTGEYVTFASSASGPPYINTGTTANAPIKPNTFTITVASNVIPDDGSGTIVSNPSGSLNYATGAIVMTANLPLSNFVAVSYTCYANSVTPAAGLTTGGSGSFSANITIPTVSIGNYNVTAIDSKGNLATNSLTVINAIPENLSIGTIAILSLAAVFASLVLAKQPKIRNKIHPTA